MPPTDERLVDDAMLRRPKTLPPDAPVGAVRSLLGDDHVHVALLVDGARLVGTLALDDLPAGVTDADAALPLARLAGRMVRSGTALADARQLLDDALDGAGSRRLAVVDDAGDLVGLLCLKRRRDGDCTDVGVAARRREREGRV